VIRPREVVSARGQTALLIDDLDARPLSELLAQPITVATAMRRAIGLARALGHVHERGLVHRNLRPDTIWVDHADRVWLTGLGGASQSRRERPDLVGHDTPTGSPIYMSPEQTGRVNRSVDTRSDLYVLGIILYQMLAGGSLPFLAGSPSHWIHYHIARKPNRCPTPVPRPPRSSDSSSGYWRNPPTTAIRPPPASSATCGTVWTRGNLRNHGGRTTDCA